MQDLDFGKDIEIFEASRLLLVAEGVRLWGFGDVLASRVLIKDLRTGKYQRSLEHIRYSRWGHTSVRGVRKHILVRSTRSPQAFQPCRVTDISLQVPVEP